MPIVPRVTRSQPNEDLEPFLLADSSDVSAIRDIVEDAPDPGSPEAHYQVTFQPGDYSGVSGVEVPPWVNVVVLPGATFSGGAFTGATDNVVDLNRLAEGAFEIGDNLTVPGRLRVLNSTASGVESVFEQNLRVKGDLTVEDDIVAQSVTEMSSRTLKRGVRDITADEAVGIAQALRPVWFTWRESGSEDFGLIAEQVADVLPEAVSYGDDGAPQSVNYGRLTAVLIRAVQAMLEDRRTI